eukprot:scaffold91_cov143-Skeletonema_menzelii.AAC.11
MLRTKRPSSWELQQPGSTAPVPRLCNCSSSSWCGIVRVVMVMIDVVNQMGHCACAHDEIQMNQKFVAVA